MQAETGKEGIKTNFKNWKIRIDERSRGRMKFMIKLSKEEAEAFKNFKEIVQPEDMDDADFLRNMFFTGWNALNQDLARIAKEYKEKNPEKFQKPDEKTSPSFNIVREDDELVENPDRVIVNDEVE